MARVHGADRPVVREDGGPRWTAPAAVRQRRARLGDLRLWAGVVLLAVCALVGFAWVGGDDDTVTVWRAARDLGAGSAPTDLEAVQVASEVAAAGYLRPSDDLDGRLRWPVAAGELLPAGSLAVPTTAADMRQVTVPVDPLHAPVGLVAGDVVDAWVTPRSDTASAVDAGLVLGGAIVSAVSTDALGLGGELGIVLEVPAEDVPRIVAAARGGVLDLVAVPQGSQEATS
jgi:hypothetical protein